MKVGKSLALAGGFETTYKSKGATSNLAVPRFSCTRKFLAAFRSETISIDVVVRDSPPRHSIRIVRFFSSLLLFPFLLLFLSSNVY